jgi:hypothetical protein
MDNHSLEYDRQHSPGPLCIFPISRCLVKKRVTPVQGFTYAFVCVRFVDVMAMLPLI